MGVLTMQIPRPHLSSPLPTLSDVLSIVDPPTPMISFLASQWPLQSVQPPTPCLLILAVAIFRARCLRRRAGTDLAEPVLCPDSRPPQALICPSLVTSHSLTLFLKGLHRSPGAVSLCEK